MSSNSMVKKNLVVLTFLIAISTIVNSQQLKNITFVPHWLPHSQFAGYYIARDLGIYKKHGLDVTIITGGPKVSSATMLEKGQSDFACLWLSNAIQLKAHDVDVVNVAQLINRSALMLVSKKSSGIKTPEDMEGKKVGLWGGDFQLQPMAFFNKYNVSVITVMQGNSLNLFYFDGIDVTSAMWYNEYHAIVNAGYNPDELNTFFFADYGLNFPEDGIYCSGEFYRNNPDVCRKFIAATLEGWKYAFEHPEETVEIMIKHLKEAGQAANKAHQRWMLARMKDLMFPSKNMDNFEKLTEENYLFVGQKLKETWLIENIPSFESLYKPIILRKAK
ncbi:MAG: ABC transporter substrate-binding protein [bacterium]